MDLNYFVFAGLLIGVFVFRLFFNKENSTKQINKILSIVLGLSVTGALKIFSPNHFESYVIGIAIGFGLYLIYWLFFVYLLHTKKINKEIFNLSTQCSTAFEEDELERGRETITEIIKNIDTDHNQKKIKNVIKWLYYTKDQYFKDKADNVFHFKEKEFRKFEKSDLFELLR